MATKSTVKDGEVYRDVPVGDDDKGGGTEVFQDEGAAVEAEAMETGIAAAAKPKFVKRMPKPMEMGDGVPGDGVPKTGESDEWNVQQTDDFWTCCIAQGVFGLIGSWVVLCKNSHRKDYPTPQAWNGCMTGFCVVLVLYIILVGLGNANNP